MSTAPTPAGLNLVAIAQILERLAGELRARASNLDEGLDDLGDASKCANDEAAETYVNAILSPLRIARPRHVPDDREAEGPSRLLDVHAVAAMLGVSTKTVRAWRSARKIPQPLVLGGSVLRWRRVDVDAWLDANGGAA